MSPPDDNRWPVAGVAPASQAGNETYLGIASENDQLSGAGQEDCDPKPSPKPDDLLAAALDYACRGWRVLPLHNPIWRDGQLACSCGQPHENIRTIGKHPRTAHGVSDATVDPELIRAWWSRWPDANIGIATGKVHGSDQYLGVADADDAAQTETLRDWGLPQTMSVSTGRGLHAYFQCAEPVPHTKIDAVLIRGEGGYVVAPPSLHPFGNRYQFRNGRREPATIDEWPAGAAQAAAQNDKSEQSHPLADDDIIARASTAQNGAKFSALFSGDWSGHTSQSEADLALCGIIAFWTQDPAQIDRIFRRSGLFREKWDQQYANGETYATRTIFKALCGRMSSYQKPERQARSVEKPPRDRNKSTKLQQAMVAIATSFPDLAYDSFRRRNVGTDEFIESSAMLTIEKECGFTPSPQVVRAAITQVAISRRFDSLLDFVNALPPWDGTERLNTWLQVYIGATDNPKYLARAGRYFLIGMLARALRPGCKMDNVLNLEGPQGGGKSTTCEIFGGEFFGRPSTAEFGSRDHINEIQGRWLIEFPDLGNLSRADKRKLKAFFSEREDEFTKKYISEPTQSPRRCVFIITDNPDPDGFSWLEDPTGARRIWAVTCGALDLRSLARDRLQLFAEARKALEAGEQWWPTPEEQRDLFGPRQEAFLGVDEWFEPVAHALQEAKKNSGYPDGHPDFWVTTDSILDAMGIPVAQRTRAATMKVGKNLRALGLESRSRWGMTGRAYCYPSPAPDGPKT